MLNYCCKLYAAEALSPTADRADGAGICGAGAENPYDVVLTDYNLPSWNGMGTVEVLRREDRDIPVVLVSGSLGELKACGVHQTRRGRLCFERSFAAFCQSRCGAPCGIRNCAPSTGNR